MSGADVRRALCLTTINAPNACLRALDEGARGAGVPFFIAGDTKTPAGFTLPGATYLSIEEQGRRFPRLCALLPVKHYTRKNTAYLAAIKAGAGEIQETDDDNFPRAGFWRREAWSAADVVRGAGPWLNVYGLFGAPRCWPRGLPLEFVQRSSGVSSRARGLTRGLIAQGLADENPDVDAVYRLTHELPVSFADAPAVVLAPGTWCPFNSQNTVFAREVFSLLYLPSHCSFRMTDIWRSFVAQRCLWELGEGVVFHGSTVWQERNEHNLLRDFADEVPGYLNNDRIRVALEAARLVAGDTPGNLVLCYEALVAGGFVPGEELALVRAWISELGVG